MNQATSISDREATPQTGQSVFRAEYGHFIGGEWVQSSSDKTITQYNPATGQALARVPAGNAQDVDRAVAAARAAFPKWSRSTAAERQEVLLAIAQRLRKRQHDFGMMESLNNGKTLGEATFFDIVQCWEQFELFAGAAHSLHGETRDYPTMIGLVHREAIGVVAQIIPWNVPLAMASMKLAPALAAGCCVVLKPAETTSLSIMELMDEIKDIVPPGVINVINGYGADVGEALVTHPHVRKVAFTGSTPTGRKVMQYASANLIPQTMELGGKSANIVCADADLDAAAQGAALSTVFNKGEVCMAGSRVFVHSSVKEKFLEKFVREIEAVQPGNPLDMATRLGAVASKAQFDKILGYIDIARDEGARVLTGGSAVTEGDLANGYFIRPTILDGVENHMRVAQEEIFGPVTSVLSWDDEDEVIAKANDSRYGLAGAVWTNDLKRGHRMARNMETGIVWLNTYYLLPMGMPIGGYKQSGFGREYCWDILRDYTVVKSVMVNLD